MEESKNKKKSILQLFKRRKKASITPSIERNAKWKGRKSKSWLWV